VHQAAWTQIVQGKSQPQSCVNAQRAARSLAQPGHWQGKALNVSQSWARVTVQG
jgi:hypothetical protein